MNSEILNIKFSTKKTSDLSKKIVKEIYKIKDSFWKYGKNSQELWFRNNVKKNDIHNLLIYRNKLVGYTLLRKREMKVYKKKKNKLFFN